MTRARFVVAAILVCLVLLGVLLNGISDSAGPYFLQISTPAPGGYVVLGQATSDYATRIQGGWSPFLEQSVGNGAIRVVYLRITWLSEVLHLA